MTKSDFTQDGSVREFFWFMDEREKIYQRKLYDEPRPWANDPILDKYFFCNVYRENDKVTKWIRENWREPHKDAPPEIMIFNMVVARFFNFIPTLELIGWTQNWEKQRTGDIAGELKDYQEMGRTSFNAAYLIAGTDLKGKNKIDGVCDRLDWAWKNLEFITAGIVGKGTLQGAWEVLQQIPGVAGFIAYEIVTDLRHTPILSKAPDIMTWANPGPGAIRGLQRMYGRDYVKLNTPLHLMRLILAEAPFQTTLKLEMRDIEHTLCEYDKYLRIKQAIKEGRPVLGMRRYRM